ncbi:MAG TPA: ferritin-like domain-containing protein [Nocardioidaceae bacterium]|nr:ferritin-like domain-containing protein [Nocardioidaceae bacterium]
MPEPMDVEEVLASLQDALQAQGRSILTMTVLAGTMRGVGGAAIKGQLREFVLAELADTYLLVEKMSAIGGTPRIKAESIEVSQDTQQALDALLDHEARAVAGFHAVIAHSGQEPRSEALEHLLEHMIMRKQQQVDFLWHATERDEPLVYNPDQVDLSS